MRGWGALLLLAGCGGLDVPTMPSLPSEVAPTRSGPSSTGGAPDRPPACPDDPVAMVRAAYAPYLADQLPVPLVQATCWSTHTRAAIVAAQAKADASGTPFPGFDPLIDAQDYQIDAVLIEKASPTALVARFSNFGTPQAVTWTIQSEDGHPRVQDLHTDRWRLSERLR